MEKSEQPPEFVGWWELMFYTRGGQSQDIEGIIERIHSDGRFEAYRNGVQVAAGCHVDFHTDPPGFTNVQQDHHLLRASDRDLTIYRFVGQTLEVCKAPERDGRPDRFESLAGSNVVHVAIHRIPDTDPRIVGQGKHASLAYLATEVHNSNKYEAAKHVDVHMGRIRERLLLIAQKRGPCEDRPHCQ